MIKNWVKSSARAFVLVVFAVGSLSIVNGQSVEIPESISLGLLRSIFQPVTFPHLDHAHMSEMGAGCVTCHHYADDDIYDPCADCHTNDPDDLDSGIPSLNAAYHRKCLSCHREWNGGNVCGTCHIKVGESAPDPASSMSGNKAIQYPEIVSFQTPAVKSTQVTFHHAEHVELFRIDCATCHQNENCKMCHGQQEVPKTVQGDLMVRHVPCSKCHDVKAESGCEKCHLTQPRSGFTHDMTTFPLKAFHQVRKCTDCHDASTQVQKLDKTCTNCHKNFEVGSFDHAATGLVLELGHEEFDCYECHLDNRFDQPPSCYECHEDEMSYPDDLPGTRLD